MKINGFQWIFLTWLFIFLIISLACNFPTKEFSTPIATIPVSTEEVKSLVDEVDKALNQSQKTGRFSITFTETQITSFVAYELSSVNGINISDMQIHLLDNHVLMTFTVIQNGISLPGEMSFTVQPDNFGKVTIAVVDAKVGSIPLPDTFLQMFTKKFSDSVTNEIILSVGDLYIENITIDHGEMHIEGTVK